MSNEVEIKVKSTDKTDWVGIKSKAKSEGGKTGDEAGKSFGSRMKSWFTRSGNDSSKTFGSTVKKWFAGDGSKLFGQGGQITGDAFKNGLGGILKTPVLGPLFAAGLAGAAAVAAPAAGAIAASGLVLAFGAGLAGLGIMFAAKTKPVQDAWSKTLKGMGSDMSILSKPFEKTLISIAGIADRTFKKFVPSLQAVFKEMAPAVTKFVDQVGRGFEKLQPTIRPLGEAFDAVLGSLGPGLQSMLGSTAKGLDTLAASVKKNPDGLADTAEGVGHLTENLFGLIAKLNDANGAIEKLTGGTSAVDLLFGKANSKVGEFIGFIRQAVDPLSGLKNGLDLVAGSADKTTTAVGLTGSATKMFTQGLDPAQLQAMGISTTGLADANTKAAPAVESLTTKFNRQKSATDALVTSLFRMQGLALSLSGAQIGMQAAIDAASASVKANGKTLDINTEKGRNNKSALDAVAQAANTQTEAMIRGGKGLTASYTAAAKSREGFVALAMQMGATKPQAEAMAKSMIAIPNVTRKARLTAEKKDLETKLAAARKELADKNLTKERKAQLNAEIKKLVSQVNAAQAKIDGLHGKTVTNNVVTRYTSVGSRSSGSGVGGGHEIDGKWNGGKVLARMAGGGRPPLKLSSRQFIAGEYGEELVEVDGTGNVRVTPTGNTRRRFRGPIEANRNRNATNPADRQLGRASGDKTSRADLYIDSAGSGIDKAILQIMQRAVQSRGGDVQLVIGGRRV